MVTDRYDYVTSVSTSDTSGLTYTAPTTWGSITTTNGTWTDSVGICPTICANGPVVGALNTVKKGEVVPMKTLYNVIVVTKAEEILLDKKVVAEDKDEARFLSDVDATLKAKSLRPADVTVLVNELGRVKVEEKVQRVKVIKDEG